MPLMGDDGPDGQFCQCCRGWEGLKLPLAFLLKDKVYA